MENNKIKIIKGLIWTGERDACFNGYIIIKDNVIVDIQKTLNIKHSADEFVIYDYGDNLVLPGFTDAHIHFSAFSKLKLYPDLSDIKTIRDLKIIVKNHNILNEKTKWLRFVNYNDLNWSSQVKMDRFFLDNILPHRPLLFSRYCGHKHVVNTLGLKIANLLKVEDPKIEKDSSGLSLGIFDEGSASRILDIISDEYESPELLNEAILSSETRLLSHGITAIHCCDVPSYGLSENYDIITKLIDSGYFKIKVVRYYDSFVASDQHFSKDTTNRFGGIKIFADGTIGDYSAALNFPYSDYKKTSGKLNYSDSDVYNLIKKAHDLKMQVQIHAIGDRAIEQVVSVIESITKKYGLPKLPYRITHATVCSGDLISRLSKLGIKVDIQYIQAFTDKDMLPKHIGYKRANESLNFRSFIDSGVSLLGSSDAPVENPNPWISIWSACNCDNFRQSLPSLLTSKHSISLNEALKTYTINPWSAIGIGDKVGLIAKGYEADLTVIEGNPFIKELFSIKDTRNIATFINGECVWSK